MHFFMRVIGVRITCKITVNFIGLIKSNHSDLVIMINRVFMKTIGFNLCYMTLLHTKMCDNILPRKVKTKMDWFGCNFRKLRFRFLFNFQLLKIDFC